MKTIKSERVRLGLTQLQLSNITGVPVRTIQNWEENQRQCPDYVQKLIFDKLHSTFDMPDYKTILEETLSMLESDVKLIDCTTTKDYITNVIIDIKSGLKSDDNEE